MEMIMTNVIYTLYKTKEWGKSYWVLRAPDCQGSIYSSKAKAMQAVKTYNLKLAK